VHAIVERNFGHLLNVQLAGLLRIVARPFERALDRAQEAFRQVGPLGDGVVGRDDRGRIDLEADFDERQRDDLFAGRPSRPC